MAEKKTIRFRYSQSKEYSLKAVNGALGGITPRGDFKIDFFTECEMLPEFVEHELVQTGLGPQTKRYPEEKMYERVLQTGALMSLKEAKNLADWIYRHIQEYEKRSGLRDE